MNEAWESEKDLQGEHPRRGSARAKGWRPEDSRREGRDLVGNEVRRGEALAVQWCSNFIVSVMACLGI